MQIIWTCILDIQSSVVDFLYPIEYSHTLTISVMGGVLDMLYSSAFVVVENKL